MTDKTEQVEAKPIKKAIVRKEPQQQDLAPQTLTPAEMLSIAVTQGCDTEKLKNLMDLQERYEANHARKAYAEALVKFRAACPTITRTGSANYGAGKTSYTYAQLPDAVEQIQKLMQECQLAVTWQTPEQTPTWIQVKCTVTHVLGHCESTTLGGPPDTSGSKNQLQAIKSAWSYLRRTTLWSLLGLVDKDEVDDDGAGGKKTEPHKPKSAADPESDAKTAFWELAKSKAGRTDMTRSQAGTIFKRVQESSGKKSAAECLEYLKREDVLVGKDGTISVVMDEAAAHAALNQAMNETQAPMPMPTPIHGVCQDETCRIYGKPRLWKDGLCEICSGELKPA